MFILTSSAVILLILIAAGLALFWGKKRQVVAEDNVAVTVNKDGFIKRILPPGRHTLAPFEKIEFTLETKNKLTANQAAQIATADGVLVTINWSGIYTLNPQLITENVSQRLRNLPYAEKAIARQTDICLRKFIGEQTTPELFNPAIRERLERHLSQLVADRLKSLGIVLVSLNLQAIDLPREVTEAMNKARAMAALDNAIRQLDPATREVVRGVYQLDEMLHWDHYLPVPTRLGMKRLETSAQIR
jgi:regulator of protease activity HflC (stomatin/prohibitin superfamily)